MLRRHVLAAGPVVLLLALASAGWAGAPAKKVNVLVLFSDDQRADTIAALGTPHIRTPNLDALARSGFVFTDAYNLGGDRPAVCQPSRNMFLSGRAYFRFGGLASARDPNLPASLKALGYQTSPLKVVACVR